MHEKAVAAGYLTTSLFYFIYFFSAIIVSLAYTYKFFTYHVSSSKHQKQKVLNQSVSSYWLLEQLDCLWKIKNKIFKTCSGRFQKNTFLRFLIWDYVQKCCWTFQKETQKQTSKRPLCKSAAPRTFKKIPTFFIFFLTGVSIIAGSSCCTNTWLWWSVWAGDFKQWRYKIFKDGDTLSLHCDDNATQVG